ncbi:MAG: polysaccharide deacetylase family protein [Candidatus Helarchaeota archaeon]|nr:polysaccharide deacetylase family protein [Candidatus Helarchaeota archaeon]
MQVKILCILPKDERIAQSIREIYELSFKSSNVRVYYGKPFDELKDINSFDLICIESCQNISSSLIKKLQEYIHNNGNLFVSGFSGWFIDSKKIGWNPKRNEFAKLLGLKNPPKRLLSDLKHSLWVYINRSISLFERLFKKKWWTRNLVISLERVRDEIESLKSSRIGLYILRKNPIFPIKGKIWFEGLTDEHTVKKSNSNVRVLAYQAKNRWDVLLHKVKLRKNVAITLREEKSGGRILWIIRSLPVYAAHFKRKIDFFPFGIAINFLRRMVCWLTKCKLICLSYLPANNSIVLTGDIHYGSYTWWHNISVEEWNKKWYNIKESEPTLALRYINELKKYGHVPVTFFVSSCFFDSEYGRKWAELMENNGVELSLHGYNNEILTEMSEEEVLSILKKSLKRLPSAKGHRSHGYRSNHKSRELIAKVGISYISDDHIPHPGSVRAFFGTTVTPHWAGHFDTLYINPTSLVKEQSLYSFRISIDDYGGLCPGPIQFQKIIEYILIYWREYSPVLITVQMHPVVSGGIYEQRHGAFALPLKILLKTAIKYSYKFFTMKEILEYFEFVKNLPLSVSIENAHLKIESENSLKRDVIFEIYSSPLQKTDLNLKIQYVNFRAGQSKLRIEM